MSNYPRDTSERAKIRDDILQRQLAFARHEATVLGRSSKCGQGWHADPETNGCRNKGDGCVCECHDVIDVLAVSA
jgi:hypothetical protein